MTRPSTTYRSRGSPSGRTGPRTRSTLTGADATGRLLQELGYLRRELEVTRVQPVGVGRRAVGQPAEAERVRADTGGRGGTLRRGPLLLRTLRRVPGGPLDLALPRLHLRLLGLGALPPARHPGHPRDPAALGHAHH